MAKQLAARKDIRDKLSKMEGDDVTEEELLGRIIREINRNVDYETARVDGGVADWNLRALVGCEMLQCSLDNGVPVGSQDPNYYNHFYNQEFIGANLDAWLTGQAYPSIGLTSDGLTTKNIKNNPSSAAIAGTAMITYGLASGGRTVPIGARLWTGLIGGGTNAAYQGYQVYQSTDPNENMDWWDVGIGSVTGFASAGTTLIPSLSTNIGGALLSSDIKGENPNASIAGAAGGTVLGYGIGRVIEAPLNARFNPWYRPDWVSTGRGYTLQEWNTPSIFPAMGGSVGGGLTQEIAGDAIKNQVQPPQSNSR